MDYTKESKGFARAKKALENFNFENVIPACTEEIESSESESAYKMEATLLRGTFYLLTGCPVEALADFDSIINNTDVAVILRVNALIKKASLNIQSGNTELGFENFAMAEELDPNNADIYHQRGQVYILMEQLDKAVPEFSTAVRLSPHQGITYVQKCYAEYRLAIITQNQMGLFEVMNALKQAIDKFPDCVECYSIMAQVLTEQGQYEQADLFYEKAIALAPMNAAFLVHRGIMQMQWNGDVAKAIAYMQQSIVIDDKCELAYETLGTIDVQRGNLENAVVMFENAITLAKTEAELIHLYALRNAAIAQINVTKKLGIDMSTLSAIAAGAM